MTLSRLSVLGEFSLELGPVKAPSLATQKARALLAYLVTHHESNVGREALLDVLWPDVEPERAKEGLRSALWSIRRAIRDASYEPDEFVTANRAVVRWNAQTWFDAAEFVKLSQSSEPSQLKDALALYKGDFLEGDYEEWTVAERTRLGNAYESVLARLVRTARSHEAAQLLLTRNPYDEPSYFLLIERELSAGRIVSAEALAERCERAMAEVGAQPSPDLRKLVSGIASRQIQSIPKLVLPFVGRENELAKVRDKLMDTANPGGVVLVSGEPGIGKSAFLSRAADIANNLGRAVITVRCFDSDSRRFGAFEELYGDLCDEPLNPLAAPGRWDLADRLAESLTNALEPMSVVTIDDAHVLADEALGAMVAIAARGRTRGHTLLVATRTEGLPVVLAALGGCSVESITLGPLRRDDIRAAVDSIVADNQEVVVTTVFERSGGHPLFATTLLESLAQSGVLRADRGAWRLVGILDEHVALPKTLTTYIQARLHTRGDTALLVAAALALEPSATPDDITAALQLPESKVFDALDDMLALGVVIQPVSGPQLAFAHDLYREVAATILNVGRRMRLHRALAERLAASASPESSLRSARHLSLAGDAMAAGDAYYRAARDALNQCAWVQARDLCLAGIAGLEVLERKPEVETLLARLKMIAAKVQTALGDSRSAVAAASDAVALAKRSGEPGAAIEAALARQRAFLDDLDTEAALQCSPEILAMARDAKDDQALSIALADQSCLQRLLGRETEAVQASREAEAVANTVGDWDILCYALEQRILADATWWKFDDGLDAVERTNKLLVRASRPAQTAIHCAVAGLYLPLEERAEASSRIDAAAELLEEDAREARRSVHSPVAGWLATSFGPARLKLAIAATTARLALESDAAERALAAVADLEGVKARRAQQLASVFRADALFASGLPGAQQNALLPLETLRADAFAQDVLSGIRSPEMAEILNAVVLGSSNAPERVAHALDLVEASARRTPLDADRAFAQLAHAAESCRANHVAARARLRRDDYRELRAAASSRAGLPERIESSKR